MVLNLKTNTGSLGKNWLDLPSPPRSSSEPYYFRRRESRYFPPSYRSGLVFFGAIMIVTLLGLTGIQASTLAESQQSWMSAQLLGERHDAFDRLIKLWKNPEKKSLLNELNLMKPLADQIMTGTETSTDPESPAESFLKAFEQGFPTITTLLGTESPQRLLIFLQDPAQKTATGGALSAGVEILINEGNIITWKPFSSQELDSIAGANGGLSTANGFLDFPESAQKMHWFWQREAHSSADAIIVVTTNALEKILGKANFSQQWTSLRLAENNEDLKSIASSSIEQLLSIVKNPDLFLPLWPTMQTLVEQKQMMIVSTDPGLQKTLLAFDLCGALPSLNPHQDALMVASINTESNASDLSIEEHDRLETVIEGDGSFRHWLNISRKQSSQATENHSMMKILVPLGSVLTAVDGLNITEVNTMNTDRFTVWSFPMSLAPGESKSLALSYTLPWRFDTSSVDNYRLTLLKQPGAQPVSFQQHLKLPADLTIFQQLPEQDISVWDRDIDIAVVAGKNP